jgi:DNA-binding LacI/PurR family transcriptional regulator
VATRADVARHAGVSESTVSYVMSGSRPISATTRARVLASMDELHYIPNAIARGLAGRRTGIIAWHVPVDVHGVSATELEYVFAATQEARAGGRHVLLWTNPVRDVEGLVHLVAQGLVDGVVLTEVYEDDLRVDALRAVGVPFVLVGRSGADDVPSVDADFVQMADLAVEHLAALGHENVVWLSEPSEVVGYGPAVRLSQALRGSASRRRVEVSSVVCGSGLRQGYDAYVQVRDLGATAVLGLNELALVGVVQEAQTSGIRVPDDLSVMALGVGKEAAALTSPVLTTVAASGRTMGHRSVCLLDEVIAGGRPPQELIPCVLHVGGSTGRAPGVVLQEDLSL